MNRKYIPLVVTLFIFNFISSQELILKKGVILDSIIVKDSVQESFSLYLPTKFEDKGKWPVLFVFDTNGKGRQAMAMFREVAEKENYILASSNNINDTISISKNVQIAGRMIAKVNSILPMHKNRVYTAGFSAGGRLANLMPVFFKDIEGTITAGASLANIELLTTKNPFYFIGIVGKEDFNYTSLLTQEKILNRYKFPNNIFVFDGGQVWPESKYLQKALRFFTLSAMAKGNVVTDSIYIKQAFKEDADLINQLKKDKKLLLADRAISEMLEIYRKHINTDSLKTVQKNLKKDKLYRSLSRNEKAAFFKEDLLKEDYVYYLEEDVYTYNYNNLGWWNYQVAELNKFIYGDSKIEKQMGKRLHAYLNALIEDNFEIVKAEKTIDDEALIFLSMLKTITEPKNYEYYLNVISLSSKYEDYGTARFYLEEAFKKGFKEKEKLDKLEHTALLRITPEYNKLMTKYLDAARYRTTDE
ncbi:alpha/beta hydrolase [uncultured Croceitalea sp.]|uniref:alpha/beta hydrolase n=1 Tax=uncultured Croceitalea sp. TaxID=1798908 RepID=UPI00374E4D59